MSNNLRILLLAFFTYTCSPIDDHEIVGQWSAYTLETDSNSYKEELESVQLSLSNNNYTFTGTLGSKENGTYELVDSFLILNQREEESQIVLKIIKIVPDTLVLEMKNHQILTLVK